MLAAVRSANIRPSYAQLRSGEVDTSSFVPLLPSWLRRRADYVQLPTPLQRVLSEYCSVSFLRISMRPQATVSESQKSPKKTHLANDQWPTSQTPPRSSHPWVVSSSMSYDKEHHPFLNRGTCRVCHSSWR